MCAGLHDPPSALLTVTIFDRYTFFRDNCWCDLLVFGACTTAIWPSLCPTKFPALHWGTQTFNSLRWFFTFFQLGKNGWFGVRGAFPYFVWLKLGPIPHHIVPVKSYMTQHLLFSSQGVDIYRGLLITNIGVELFIHRRGRGWRGHPNLFLQQRRLLGNKRFRVQFLNLLRFESL